MYVHIYAYLYYFEASKVTQQNVRELEEFRMMMFHTQGSRMTKMEIQKQ